MLVESTSKVPEVNVKPLLPANIALILFESISNVPVPDVYVKPLLPSNEVLVNDKILLESTFNSPVTLL